LNIDQHIAMHLAESLVFAAQAAHRPQFEALGIMAMGDVFRVLGDYEESVAMMDEAGRRYQALGDEVGWARTRNGWLRSSHLLGRGEEALVVADRAREILAAHGVWLRAANLTYNTAFVCTELGRYAEALARFDHAEEIYASLGESAELEAARMKFNKADLLAQLGEFDAALRLFEEIRLVYLRHHQVVSLLRQENSVAIVRLGQGHYTQALQHGLSVRAAMEAAGLDIEVDVVALDIIECYLNLNRNADALELAEETSDRFARRGALTLAAKARFFCALAHARLGNTTHALSLLDAAAQTFAVSGMSAQHALIILQQAMLHLDDEDWEAARDNAARAAALSAAHGLPIRQAQADLVRARALLAFGDAGTAAALAHSVLAVSEEREVPWLKHEAYHVLGGVAERNADLPSALAAYDAAVSSIERMQSALAIDLRSDFLADKLRVYEDAIAVSLRLARPALAFAYLERAKSRALVDYLGNNLEVQVRAREGADPDLLATLDRLRSEHHFFYRQLYDDGLLHPDDAVPARFDAATLRDAVREREKQIARLLERLALDRTEGLAIAHSAVREDDAVPLLAADTVLFEYHFRADGAEVFVVSPAGLRVVPLAVRPNDISRLLQQWQLNLGATARAVTEGAGLERLGHNARGILTALYRALIAPVASDLAGYERLIVIPYGPTHAVPFHALFDGERYLIETIEVSTCPSSSLLHLCAARPQHGERSALVIGHTHGGRLPAVLDEARAVATILPGEMYLEEAATRSATIAAAPRHRVIHLAAHGEARLDNPTFAHLQLADGQLSVIDVFNLQLHGALVTLSACETGRTTVTGGDELIGLSRGFLYAGAATLVQSLWRVEDRTTARLMGDFYRHLGRGASKGAALRAAQCAALDAHGAHPWYWAPFQLIGDAGQL
jgi:CHAT domain-containing protein